MMGKVYLVGAGAGSFWYLTERARMLLENAHVIVYDHLIDFRTLLLSREDAELISSRDFLQQDDLHSLLVARAKEGKTVVRLKGGDPFVFGRGGEEALYLATYGIPFEVVPGVSSVHVAASRACIPLTFRGKSRSFHVFSGHPREALSSLPWELIARLPGTLVFLMGCGTLGIIAHQLIQAGKDPKTPVSLVEWAGTPRERVVFASLEDIDRRRKEEDIQNPAVLFVGEMVSLGHMLKDKKPFPPKRVMVIGSGEVLKVSRWMSTQGIHLEERGIEVIPVPILRAKEHSEVIENLIAHLHKFDTLLFTSQNAVSVFFAGWLQRGCDLRSLAGKCLWAIGDKTAGALRDLGLWAEYVAPGNALALLQETACFPSRQVAVLTSSRGGETLQKGFTERGWISEVFPLYSMVCDARLFPIVKEEVQRGIDLMVFLSPSSFEAFTGATSGTLPHCSIWAIGPTTAAFLNERGIPVERILSSPSFENLLEEVLLWYRNS